MREAENALHPAPNDGNAIILVVDDDRGIRELVAATLREQGYVIETAADTSVMDLVLTRAKVDLVLLDVMMPGEDGLSAGARLMRDDGPPVIFLSALSHEQDRVTGLDLGADHYLAKPCSARELVATVRATLRARRKSEPTPMRRYRFDGWCLDLVAHELTDEDGVLVTVTDGEFAILRSLVERPRRILSREMLLQTARGPDSDAFDRAVDVQISRLRRKLRTPGDELIKTVRNEGYIFVPRVLRDT